VIDEYENEKIRGLPQDLPAGETLLWQGSPDWRSLARHMVHVNKVAIYFAALAAWSIMTTLKGGGTGVESLVGIVRVTLIGGVGIALLCLIAWLTARTTVYSITSRRVVMRMGIVVPMTMNLPFRTIGSAGVKRFKDGTGDIALGISSGDRLAFLHLWPHVRPWRINNPEPSLRSLPELESASAILGTALAAFAASNPGLKPAQSKLVLFPQGHQAAHLATAQTARASHARKLTSAHA
jgi:Bacterial PH domain